MAQVAGLRGEVRTEEDLVRRFEVDIAYIQKWSFWLDCSLVLNTVTQIISPPKHSDLNA
jgi:putative colanic acid biosynthesis UDP-glucose lipid carrier transferase